MKGYELNMSDISFEKRTILWIWSKCVFQASDSKLFKLIDIFGSVENLFALSKSEIENISGLSEKEKSRLLNKNLTEAQKIYENAQKHGFGVTSLGNDDYPYLLAQTEQPPPVLYYKGNIRCLNNRLAIAGVGTRKCDENAFGKMKEISFDLASRGIVIVSGMALGIDSAAHSGALEANGVTVAVLGTAIDRIYPAENHDLYCDIIENGGAVISEHPLGYRGFKSDFVRRNRIIAGLSHGVLLCQAPKTSGSVTTAKFALDFGRDTFCVPGNADEINEGGNRLIMDGCAKLVLSAEDILSEYEGREIFDAVSKEKTGKSKKNSKTDIKENNKKYDALSGDAKRIVEYLKDKKVLCDVLGRDLNIEYSSLGAIITELEIEDVLQNDNGYISLK